jgi:hypothetical protein
MILPGRWGQAALLTGRRGVRTSKRNWYAKGGDGLRFVRSEEYGIVRTQEPKNPRLGASVVPQRRERID